MQEPATSFSNAALKIIWANEHIKQLHAQIERFNATQPYEVVRKRDSNTGKETLEINQTKPLPHAIALATGDACANLRSALDYAWMGLVRAADPQAKDKKTLPIGNNREDLAAKIKNAPIGVAKSRAHAVLVDQVRAHRDAADGGNLRLAALNKLSNWNKHNLLIMTLALANAPQIVAGTVVITNNRFGGQQAAVAAFGLPSDHNIEYKGEPTAEVVFNGHEFVGGKQVLSTLVEFREECTQALKAFCEAFPHPDNPSFR